MRPVSILPGTQQGSEVADIDPDPDTVDRYSANRINGAKRQLSREDSRRLDQDIAIGNGTPAEIAERYGVAKQTVFNRKSSKADEMARIKAEHDARMSIELDHLYITWKASRVEDAQFVRQASRYLLEQMMRSCVITTESGDTLFEFPDERKWAAYTASLLKANREVAEEMNQLASRSKGGDDKWTQRVIGVDINQGAVDYRKVAAIRERWLHGAADREAAVRREGYIHKADADLRMRQEHPYMFKNQDDSRATEKAVEDLRAIEFDRHLARFDGAESGPLTDLDRHELAALKVLAVGSKPLKPHESARLQHLLVRSGELDRLQAWQRESWQRRPELLVRALGNKWDPDADGEDHAAWNAAYEATLEALDAGPSGPLSADELEELQDLRSYDLQQLAKGLEHMDPVISATVEHLMRRNGEGGRYHLGEDDPPAIESVDPVTAPVAPAPPPAAAGQPAANVRQDQPLRPVPLEHMGAEAAARYRADMDNIDLEIDT